MMTLTLLVAMTVFSLTMSISPGPVNMVIVSSGANHGFRRTLPFVSGATIGFTLLLIFVGFAFMQVVTGYPRVMLLMGLAGSAFIIYIGWRIASSSPSITLEKDNVPTFMQGFLLQWLNPKAWIACASGAALFSDPDTKATLITFITIYFLVCYASLAAWAVLGDRVALVLNSRERIRAFNMLMGGLLIASACYLVYGQLGAYAA
ncbi:MAG TPA: LysE family translocator [Noviherbaspirillum sp.]|uniref:LysE family translocator n=1 Tax=Noviherbaspirillum sp. TaxID=1926288 RepID=UPI002D668C11|nr:LysE family translocator [Noviherbaspirillum sp.]HYD97279.1 LysE family translocator [Noviherbaspirillum sp.]